MQRLTKQSVVIAMILACFTISSQAQEIHPQRPVYGGSGILRVPAGRNAGFNAVIPTAAPISGYQEVTYMWRLIKPARMPRGVTLGFHMHQDPRPYTSLAVMAGTSGLVEASYHSGYEVLNKSGQEIVLEIRYVAWDEGTPSTCQ